jgi:glucose-1-phosphate cytidylyltransferase
MKLVILAGGYGTRISEETDSKPKPMVLLDDKPIIWHLMNSFARQGFKDFVIATGYMGHVIHEWVARDLNEDWNVVPVDTGLDTQTAGRIAGCESAVGNQPFFATYGDGLGNVNLKNLLDFHKGHGLTATVTAVRPPARFGLIESLNGRVTHFGEKNQADAGWINGGYFILEPEIFDYVREESKPFEQSTLPRLVAEEKLAAFLHEGFWQPMDTLREKNELSVLASLPVPPWLSHEN